MWCVACANQKSTTLYRILCPWSLSQWTNHRLATRRILKSCCHSCLRMSPEPIAYANLFLILWREGSRWVCNYLPVNYPLKIQSNYSNQLLMQSLCHQVKFQAQIQRHVDCKSGHISWCSSNQNRRHSSMVFLGHSRLSIPLLILQQAESVRHWIM